MASSVQLSYNSSYGTASYSLSSNGLTLTVIATPKSGCVLTRIVQKCDKGNDRTEDYNTTAQTTFVSTGHSDCSTIYVTVTFKPIDEARCEYYAFTISEPAGAVMFSPSERTVYLTPGATSSFSFSVTPVTGWEVYYYRWDGNGWYAEAPESFTPQINKFTRRVTAPHPNDHESGDYHDCVLTVSARRRTFTLTFDPQGGTVSPESKVVTYGLPCGELPRPVKSGWAFVGWYTEKAGGDKITPETNYTLVKNMTVYAHWVEQGPVLYSESNDKILHGANGSVLYLGDY